MKLVSKQGPKPENETNPTDNDVDKEWQEVGRFFVNISYAIYDYWLRTHKHMNIKN